jgi:thiamine-monophosphate kinase
LKEFQIIESIKEALAESADADWIRLGIGDDAAVVAFSPGMDIVSSIDSFLPDRHFPSDAPADLVGYRAIMASFSDLAAMGAHPKYGLISLTIDKTTGSKLNWILDFARGSARAANKIGVALCGGNLANGPLSVSVSVHGEVETNKACLRAGGRPGDFIYVSGPLGSAAACVRLNDLVPADPHNLSPRQEAFYRPSARFDMRRYLESASSAIDISDGLVQDLNHILESSCCGASLESKLIPLGDSAELEDGLFGGDDYELIFTSSEDLGSFDKIGRLTKELGIRVDGEAIIPKGFDHFVDEPEP